MKTKHVYLAPDLPTAAAALLAARGEGVAEDDLALVARADVEMDEIPENLRNASTDFMPAALKGALGGGSTGLLAGLVAAAIPGLGVTLAGAAAIAAIGAIAGTWSSSLVGAALPDPVRRRFEREIAEGRILVLVDAEASEQPKVRAALLESGVEQLPFEESSSMT